MKLAVFADLHLDAAFAWLSPEVARMRRNSLRKALQKVIEHAVDERVEAVLCAGDLYEQDRFTPDLGEFIRDIFGSVDLPIFISPGNHDWIGPTSLYSQLDWPGNVHIFDEPSFQPIELTPGLRLWGAGHRAPANTDGFFDSGFEAEEGAVNVGLFHGSERHLFVGSSGKAPHAPFEGRQIKEAGLLYAFVGHYHVPKDEGSFSYPGNPEPLNFGESGCRGMLIATIDQDSVDITRVRVAETEVHDIELDLTEIAHQSELLNRAQACVAGLTGFARLTLRGTIQPNLDLDLSDLKGLDSELSAPPVIQVRDLKMGYDIESVQLESTVRGQFVRDVMASEDLTEEEKTKIVTTGLRALDGRTDLEIPG